MGNENSKLKEVMKRAKRGEFGEYWLQQYVKENYKKLGFESINGPFEKGYDFEGIYDKKKVVVEVEKRVEDFIRHKHNPKEVDILIVFNDDILEEKPELRKLLPEKIIKVDPEDFVKSIFDWMDISRKLVEIRNSLPENWKDKKLYIQVGETGARVYGKRGIFVSSVPTREEVKSFVLMKMRRGDMESFCVTTLELFISNKPFALEILRVVKISDVFEPESARKEETVLYKRADRFVDVDDESFVKFVLKHLPKKFVCDEKICPNGPPKTFLVHEAGVFALCRRLLSIGIVTVCTRCFSSIVDNIIKMISWSRAVRFVRVTKEPHTFGVFLWMDKIPNLDESESFDALIFDTGRLVRAENEEELKEILNELMKKALDCRLFPSFEMSKLEDFINGKVKDVLLKR